MDPIALVMMVVALLLVWGGLIAAILYLRSRPEVIGGPHEDPDPARGVDVRSHEPPRHRDT